MGSAETAFVERARFLDTSDAVRGSDLRPRLMLAVEALPLLAAFFSFSRSQYSVMRSFAFLRGACVSRTRLRVHYEEDVRCILLCYPRIVCFAVSLPFDEVA